MVKRRTSRRKVKVRLYVKSKILDKMLSAKKRGKRTIRNGKTYYEYRLNHADVNRKRRL